MTIQTQTTNANSNALGWEVAGGKKAARRSPPGNAKQANGAATKLPKIENLGNYIFYIFI